MRNFLKKQSPVRLIAMGFALVILLGSVLLMMPFSLEEGVSLNYTDALNLYKRQGRSFDIIFLDPPYASGFASEALEKIAALELLSADGLIVVEHDRQNGLKLPDGIGLVKERSYGKVVISLLRRLQDD